MWLLPHNLVKPLPSKFWLALAAYFTYSQLFIIVSIDAISSIVMDKLLHRKETKWVNKTDSQDRRNYEYEKDEICMVSSHPLHFLFDLVFSENEK